MIEQPEQWHAVGRRKSAVARIYLRPGTGAITINGRTFEDYFPRATTRDTVIAPFVLSSPAAAMAVVPRALSVGSPLIAALATPLAVSATPRNSVSVPPG